MYTVRLSVLAAALAWSSISVSALPPTYGVKRANVPSIPMNSFAALSMGDTDDESGSPDSDGDVHGMADPLQV
ncbi:hypothetical protein BJ085DRAFT_40470 [Dimargaris cristalligena]|uniref:Uncharacterized protein n=1 Tax=Dimargaris cristalligena TaxID=215637 RepID=A0A4Q0A0X9_9FUNG|nr:hypothetical protein BJ085DRAFT_40470 [Dimargaris cristalligena]|eukprot:RKP38780.1 hypothetical protein BJ085DRAFT_40470 [Dimargaris cristalligena]